MTRADLIARLKAAPDGSEELDIAINEFLKGRPVGDRQTYAPYTRSLDTALTLVPADTAARQYAATIWSGWASGARIFYRQRDASAEGGWALGACNDLEIRAATPALALCIAALRARP